MAIIDLHTHTTFSDGELTPKELILLAKNKGINLLSITDHDSALSHRFIKKNIDSSLLKDINLITGIEFSSLYLGMNVHIVGLNFDPFHKVIIDAEEKQKNARDMRIKKIIELLERKNFFIDNNELLSSLDTSTIGRPHLARYLVSTGQVKDIATVFRKYLGNGKIGDINQFWPNVEMVIGWIHQSGGLAVLAHPHRYNMTYIKRKKLVSFFKSVGGDGIEVFGGETTKDNHKLLLDLAKEYNLLSSIGSDFHKPFLQNYLFGKIETRAFNVVNPIWERFT